MTTSFIIWSFLRCGPSIEPLHGRNRSNWTLPLILNLSVSKSHNAPGGVALQSIAITQAVRTNSAKRGVIWAEAGRMTRLDIGAAALRRARSRFRLLQI